MKVCIELVINLELFNFVTLDVWIFLIFLKLRENAPLSFEKKVFFKLGKFAKPKIGFFLK